MKRVFRLSTDELARAAFDFVRKREDLPNTKADVLFRRDANGCYADVELVDDDDEPEEEKRTLQ